MSIDYDDALARSRDVPAFSNGTEGEVWTANWCYRCLRDAPFRNGIAKTGCPLILVALMDRTPAEWLDGPRDEHGAYSIEDQYHCIEFKGPGGGGGGEPRPKPEPPGMDGLFPRPERATRMLTQPTPAPAAEPVHADAVAALLAAWRDDIDSVPHPPMRSSSAPKTTRTTTPTSPPSPTPSAGSSAATSSSRPDPHLLHHNERNPR